MRISDFDTRHGNQWTVEPLLDIENFEALVSKGVMVGQIFYLGNHQLFHELGG